MKKLALISLVLIVIASCSKKDKVNALLENVQSKYGNFIEIDTMADGTMYYLLSKNFEPTKIKELQDFIDKTLGQTTTSVDEDTKYCDNVWETSEYKIKEHINYNYSENKEMQFEVKFFINKK